MRHRQGERDWITKEAPVDGAEQRLHQGQVSLDVGADQSRVAHPVVVVCTAEPLHNGLHWIAG